MKYSDMYLAELAIMAQMGSLDPSRLHGLLGSLQFCLNQSLSRPPLRCYSRLLEKSSIHHHDCNHNRWRLTFHLDTLDELLWPPPSHLARHTSYNLGRGGIGSLEYIRSVDWDESDVRIWVWRHDECWDGLCERYVLPARAWGEDRRILNIRHERGARCCFE